MRERPEDPTTPQAIMQLMSAYNDSASEFARRMKATGLVEGDIDHNTVYALESPVINIDREPYRAALTRLADEAPLDVVGEIVLFHGSTQGTLVGRWDGRSFTVSFPDLLDKALGILFEKRPIRLRAEILDEDPRPARP